MKNTLKNSLLAIAIISAPLATFAANKDTSNEARLNLPTYTVEDIVVAPEPIHFPIPRVSSKLDGITIPLKFEVNEKGKAIGIKISKSFLMAAEPKVRDFASALTGSLRRWKFEPARNENDDPVAVRVSMPVRIVKKDGQPTALVSIILEDSDKQI